MKHLLKWPLIITAVIVVARVLLERFGAPPAVNNTLSVLLLTILIFPLYFAVRIAKSGEEHPYRMLLKTTGLYALLARAMIIPTYWFAHIYQWPEPRFEGVVRPDVTTFKAYVLTPLNPAVLIASIVVGCGLALPFMALVLLLAKKVSLAVKTP
jgi:hypothetical protein